MTIELPEDTIIATGWGDALVGVGWRLNTPIAVYDRDKVMEMLIADGLDYSDADEYISFNIEGAYVGEGTPLFVSLGLRADLEEARDTACRLEEEIARLRSHINGLQA
jgi:hypothetical protein